MPDPVTLQRDRSVATIVLHRPEARNAVVAPTAAALREAFQAFEADPALRVAVLYGAGGTFCAGADLKALGDPARANAIEPTGSAPGPMGPTRMQLGKPVIAPRLRRAGLDYREWARVRTWPTLQDCIEGLGTSRLFAFSTRGSTRLEAPRYQPGDAFLFGPETRGLPPSVLGALTASRVVRVPMRPGARSLNLSNAVSVAAYEAWRQCGYAGA